MRGRGVQSVDVAGRILKVLVKAGKPLMLREIAAEAELTSAQAHAYLVSFRAMGMVEQDESSTRYKLGPFALQLGLARFRNSSALMLADNAARDLSHKNGHSVILSVWGTHGPTIVQFHEGERESYLFVRPGRVQRLLGSTSGRIFLAFMPLATLKPFIEHELSENRGIAVNRPNSWEAVESMRAEIAGLGYSAFADSPMEGMSAIAVPIFDHNGRLVCSISHFDQSSRMSLKPDGDDMTSIIAVSKSVSYQLGYNPTGSH